MDPEDVYPILLKVYPARYRHKYGQAMTQCFADQLRAADTRRKRLRLWSRTIVDFALNAPARHLESARTIYPNLYSERARRAIYLAQLERGPFSFGEVSLENLLLGALRSDEDLATTLLGSHGVKTLATTVREMEINKAVAPTPFFHYRGRPHPLALECKKALAKATHEAKQSGTQLSVRHILLGILDQDTSQAAHLLWERALNLSSLRDDLDDPDTRSSGN